VEDRGKAKDMARAKAADNTPLIGKQKSPLSSGLFLLVNPEQTSFSTDLREKCSDKNTQTALQASLQANLQKQFLKIYAAENQKDQRRFTAKLNRVSNSLPMFVANHF
jgi:hypothetical protein